jgi:hypothetical protein
VIGTKTLAILTLLGAVVAASLAFGSFAPERLALRGLGTLLFVGCFGLVVGMIVFRFLRLGERSRHYFRWSTESFGWDVNESHFVGGSRRRVVLGENRDGEAFDVSPRARLALCIVIAAVVALVAIGSRALDQLRGAYQGLSSSTSSLYCPEQEAPKPVVKDPNEPGCELIRRAYALGYAKTLGECAPKKETEAKAAQPVCTRRQRDEPALHYSWRLLGRFWDNLHGATRLSYFRQSADDFHKRSSHVGSLATAVGQTLSSAPHASHHIWTNLPDPEDGAFKETTCTARYLRLPHRPTPPPGQLQASKVFEHVLAQLVFEGTYDSPAGNCREYHVHWGAPLDACERLAASPESFLAAEGALGDVQQTLRRWRVAGDLTSLGGPKPAADPASLVSFSCYFEGAARPRASRPVSLGGAKFTADDLGVPPSPRDAALYIDRYDAIGRLLVNGFHYGHLLSEAGLEETSAAGLEPSFAGPDFLLTRLYELDSIDIYLDPAWLLYRPDLLEVYPYERHLKNYVQVFRRQYRRQAARL